MSDWQERMLGRFVRISLYSIAAVIMGRYEMPWYASLGVLLIVIFGAHIGPQPEEQS